MKTLQPLLDNNARWAQEMEARTPGFFKSLAGLQTPKYLWIGCADSRVPANEITGLLPGEMFVHRNVANVVVHSDLNCLSVLQFAVEVLKVEHVIVCGHYGCGGVQAAMHGERHGLVDNWLRHVRDVRDWHAARFKKIEDDTARCRHLCELNAIEQAAHVCETTVVQDAWARGQPLAVHAWIYGLKDGRLRDLGFEVSSQDGIESGYEAALDGLDRA